MHKDKDENGMLSHIHSHEAYRSRELGILEHSLLDGDMFLQVRTHFFLNLWFYDSLIQVCFSKRNTVCILAKYVNKREQNKEMQWPSPITKLKSIHDIGTIYTYIGTMYNNM